MCTQGASLNRGDAEKLHQLAEHHAIDKMSERFQKVSPADCDLCKVAAARKSKRVPQIPEGHTRTTVDLLNEIGL